MRPPHSARARASGPHDGLTPSIWAQRNRPSHMLWGGPVFHCDRIGLRLASVDWNPASRFEGLPVRGCFVSRGRACAKGNTPQARRTHAWGRLLRREKRTGFVGCLEHHGRLGDQPVRFESASLRPDVVIEFSGVVAPAARVAPLDVAGPWPTAPASRCLAARSRTAVSGAAEVFPSGA